MSEGDGKLYTGCTKDVKMRVALHNVGRVRATRNRRPFMLVYSESYANRQDAMRRERYLKSGWGRRFLKSRISKTK
jgi:putative endonuclease